MHNINNDRRIHDSRIQGSVIIDKWTKCVVYKGENIRLTPIEMSIVTLLLSEKRLFAVDEIIDYVWPKAHECCKSDVYTHISHIRDKLWQGAIANVPGFGYKIVF